LYFLFRPTEGLGSVHNPAKSCDEVLASVPGAQSGVFWLQAARGRPYQVSLTEEEFRKSRAHLRLCLHGTGFIWIRSENRTWGLSGTVPTIE